MPTAISEGIYATNIRLPGFEDQIIRPSIQQLCEGSEQYTEQMKIAIPIMMKSGWKGTVSPNSEKLLNDVKSAFLFIYAENAYIKDHSQRTELSLYQLLIMEDQRLQGIFHSLYESAHGKFHRKNESHTPTKEKTNPWKRQIAIITAAFSYWMATNELDGRHWALTRKNYQPQDYENKDAMTGLSSLVQYMLSVGKSIEQVTFFPFPTQPVIKFTPSGILEKTWK